MNDRPPKTVVGLDIGTTKVCAVAASFNSPTDFSIKGMSSEPCTGLKKGSVVHIEKTREAIAKVLGEIKQLAGEEISRVSIGIAGNHIYSFNGQGVVAIKGSFVSTADMARALEAAKTVIIPSDREILHILPLDYRIDGHGGIKNPLGMSGLRLEVKVHIVTCAASLLANLMKCVEDAGYGVEDVTLQPICSSEAVLSEEEKEAGVVVVDIGGGTTDLAVWKEGSLLHTQVIPVGGSHFTNDLAVALKITQQEAEKIKTEYGSLIPERLNNTSHITIQGLPGGRTREVKLVFVSQILSSRAEELLETINHILLEKNLKEGIALGFIFTGGGSLMRSLPELAEYILERPTKIGFPLPMDGMEGQWQNPKYATVLGLLLENRKRSQEKELYMKSDSRRNDLISKLAESLRNVFREIF